MTHKCINRAESKILLSNKKIPQIINWFCLAFWCERTVFVGILTLRFYGQEMTSHKRKQKRSPSNKQDLPEAVLDCKLEGEV